MSLIHICQMAGENPFDYLTQLLKHEQHIKKSTGKLDALELSKNALF